MQENKVIQEAPFIMSLSSSKIQDNTIELQREI